MSALYARHHHYSVLSTAFYAIHRGVRAGGASGLGAGAILGIAGLAVGAVVGVAVGVYFTLCAPPRTTRPGVNSYSYVAKHEFE